MPICPQAWGVFTVGAAIFHSGQKKSFSKPFGGNIMALIVDSGAVYALYDADDAHHAAVRRVVEHDPGPLIIPTVILAEIDYLLREFLGVHAELSFFQDVANGAFLLEPLTMTD